MEIKDRIRVILEREGLSQVDFSNRTEIKPATLNHVLTGRNNASRDVVDKILSSFPWYNEDWLVLGQGAMLTEEARQKIQEERNIPLFPAFQDKSENTSSSAKSTGIDKNQLQSASYEVPGIISMRPESKKIAKIIVYYTDNTFETLLPSEE